MNAISAFITPAIGDWCVYVIRVWRNDHLSLPDASDLESVTIAYMERHVISEL